MIEDNLGLRKVFDSNGFKDSFLSSRQMNLFAYLDDNYEELDRIFEV